MMGQKKASKKFWLFFVLSVVVVVVATIIIFTLASSIKRQSAMTTFEEALTKSESSPDSTGEMLLETVKEHYQKGNCTSYESYLNAVARSDKNDLFKLSVLSRVEAFLNEQEDWPSLVKLYELMYEISKTGGLVDEELSPSYYLSKARDARSRV